MSHRSGPPQGQNPYGQNPYGQQPPYAQSQQPMYDQSGSYDYAQPLTEPGAPSGTSNGVGIAGLTVGVIGCVCALVPPITGLGAILGIATVIVAIYAIVRVTTGKANNLVMSVAALILGIAALVAVVFMQNALTDAAPTQAEIIACLNNPATDTGEEVFACAN